MKERTWNPAQLAAPLGWRGAYLVTLAVDLFDGRTDEEIAAVFGVMLASESVFRVWTANPKRAREWYRWVKDPVHMAMSMSAHIKHMFPESWYDRAKHARWPNRRIWLGVIAHTQAELDERAPEILGCPAVMHWLWLVLHEGCVSSLLRRHWVNEHGECAAGCAACGRRRRRGIPLDATFGHIEVTGATGKDAPPCDVEWIREVIRQGKEAGVPVYVRALGSKPSAMGGPLGWANDGQRSKWVQRITARNGDRLGEWPKDLQVREWPEGVEVG